MRCGSLSQNEQSAQRCDTSEVEKIKSCTAALGVGDSLQRFGHVQKQQAREKQHCHRTAEILPALECSLMLTTVISTDNTLFSTQSSLQGLKVLWLNKSALWVSSSLCVLHLDWLVPGYSLAADNRMSWAALPDRWRSVNRITLAVPQTYVVNRTSVDVWQPPKHEVL